MSLCAGGLLPAAPVAAHPAAAPAAAAGRGTGPVLPKPTATHQFELTPEDGDLVGYVQKTTVGKDDTLPDIARRFDVGYEEMLLANPESIPGCPGSGAKSSCPRSSCCRPPLTKASS